MTVNWGSAARGIVAIDMSNSVQLLNSEMTVLNRHGRSYMDLHPKHAIRPPIHQIIVSDIAHQNTVDDVFHSISIYDKVIIIPIAIFDF